MNTEHPLNRRWSMHLKGEGKHAKPEVLDPSQSNPDLEGEDWK